MNAITHNTITTPGQTTGPNSSPVIWLLLSIPASPVCHLLYPENNCVGSSILAALLEETLKSAGQLESADGFSTPFNSSVYCLTVRDAREASQIIISLLTKQNLARYAEIYYFDQRELIYRLVLQDGGKIITQEQLEAKTKLASDRMESTRNLLLELAKLLPPPPRAPTL